ncbi:hypothetical protein B0J14DRAFT_570893 [Halenospora varia]|nr:hypothetical protein B0J14DRAFT_570893 [Halenospora varia]
MIQSASNQDDIDEKVEQVSLMRSIYALAQHVFVYLCEEQHNSAIVPAFINNQMRAESKLCGTTAERIALFSLFLRPWFTRAWVIQEFVLSKSCTVLLGREKIPWEDLMQVLRKSELSLDCQRGILAEPTTFMQAKQRLSDTLDLSAWRKQYMRDGLLLNLIDLLELDCASKRQATVARDFLFSLLGLARDGDIKAFTPDYNAPMHEVIRRYASELVCQGHFSRLISRVAGIDDNSDFQSWCPDWSQPKPSRNLNFPSPSVLTRTLDHGDIYPIFHLKDNTTEFLSILAYNLNTVCTVVPKIQDITAQFVFPMDHSILEAYLFLDAWSLWDWWDFECQEIINTFVGIGLNDSQPKLRKDWDYRTRLNRVFNVADGTDQTLDLSIGRTSDSTYFEDQGVRDLGQKAQILFSFIRGDHAIQEFKELDPLSIPEMPFDQLEDLWNHIQRLASTTTFCRCRSGTLLCVPKSTRKDDIVCSIIGTSTVFVLRKSNKQPEAFRVIGSCWSSRFADVSEEESQEALVPRPRLSPREQRVERRQKNRYSNWIKDSRDKKPERIFLY